MGDAAHILGTVLRETQAGRSVAVCVIVATRGSTPQPPGTMVCVDEAAAMSGTLGGGCVEANVRRRAHHVLSRNRSELITFALDGDFGYDDGMICGGQMDIAVTVVAPTSDLGPYRDAADSLREGRPTVLPIRVETGEGPVEYRVHLEAEPQLVIAGAGHISRVLARTVLPLGFGVHVIDDRPTYANADRFAHPIRTTVGDIGSTLRTWPIDGNTYIVIVTRGHKHDEQALGAVLDSPARYIGMIGSRRKVKVVLDDLRHDGASEEQLARVHAPIGLPIHAVTTEEIALSIAAELVSICRADRQDVVEGPIPLRTCS